MEHECKSVGLVSINGVQLAAAIINDIPSKAFKSILAANTIATLKCRFPYLSRYEFH